MLLSSGESGPPCGVPSTLGLTSPFSITPALRNARMSFNSRLSSTRLAIWPISLSVIDSIKELFQIEIDHPSVALRDVPLRLSHSVMRRSTLSNPVAVWGKRQVPSLLQNLHHRLLDKAVQHGRHGSFELHIGPASLWDPPSSPTPFLPFEVISLLC